MTDKTNSAAFIVNELGKRGVDASLWHTGGGCFAIYVERTHAPAIDAVETGTIMITDVTGTVVDLDIAYACEFLGFVAGWYPTPDDLTCGTNVTWVYGEAAYDRERQVHEAQDRGGVEFARTVAQNLYVEWRADASALVDAVATFVKEMV